MEMENVSLTYISILGIAIILLVKYLLVFLKLPSGPWGLPLLGYLPFLGDAAYETLRQLCMRYGDFMSLYLGRRLVIVLGSIDVVKELLSTESFLGRPKYPPNNLMPNAKSFSGVSGNLWREHRRFAMQSLRDLGFGKTIIEKHIKDEIEYFLLEMNQFNGQPCDVRRYLQSSISNNTTALICGRRMKYDDPERLLLDNLLRILAKFFRPTSIHAYFPWVRPFFSFFHIWDYHILEDNTREMDKFMDKEIANHKRTLGNEKARDYIDEYLLKMDKKEDTARKNYFTIEMLKGNCVSLLAAGVEPVLATTEWLILAMAVYQDVQKNVQKEMDAVVGREKMPQWPDHTNLPYSMAALMELQRWKTVVPISMLRCTTKSVDHGKYHIPEGTIIMTNLWSIHRDERYWTSPSEYKPERFIDENGKLITKHKSFIPFSFGKRACPGETLGKMEVFLYFTNILHRFHVCLPEGVSDEFENDVGIAQTVKEYKLCLVPRVK